MKLMARSFDRPDEARRFPNGSDAWLSVDELTVGRAEFQPGWRWSNDVQPIAGTASCRIDHTGYVLDGRLHVETDDGAGLDLGPGDVYVIPAGHDAWVVGDEPCVILDWSEQSALYALPPGAVAARRGGGA